jgi:hypothetical protein
MIVVVNAPSAKRTGRNMTGNLIKKRLTMIRFQKLTILKNVFLVIAGETFFLGNKIAFKLFSIMLFFVGNCGWLILLLKIRA